MTYVLIFIQSIVIHNKNNSLHVLISIHNGFYFYIKKIVYLMINVFKKLCYRHQSSVVLFFTAVFRDTIVK